jgi:hypothetical protein
VVAGSDSAGENSHHLLSQMAYVDMQIVVLSRCLVIEGHWTKSLTEAARPVVAGLEWHRLGDSVTLVTRGDPGTHVVNAQAGCRIDSRGSLARQEVQAVPATAEGSE